MGQTAATRTAHEETGRNGVIIVAGEMPYGYRQGQGAPRRQRPWRWNSRGYYRNAPPVAPPVAPAQPPVAGPSYQEINVGVGGGQPYAGPWRTRVPNIAAPIGAVLLMGAGILVIISTFLTWAGSLTGWGLMYASPAGKGNFLFTWWDKGFFFTGFWALLLGSLMLLGAVILLADRNGSDLAMVSAILVLLISIFNIVVVFINGESYPSGPGVGLWLMAVTSLVGVILGATVVPESVYYV